MEEIPCVIGGKDVYTGKIMTQVSVSEAKSFVYDTAFLSVPVM